MTRPRRALAGLLLLLAGCSGEADFSDSIETGTLSADEYREAILEIDRLAFADTKLDDERRDALAERLEKLAAQVARQKPEKYMKLESLELRALAGRVRRASSKRALADVQNQWMRIRSNLFDDEWWFARSAKDLEATATMDAKVSESTGDERPEVAAIAAEPAAVAPEVAVDTYVPLEAPGDAGIPPGQWSVEAVFANGEPRSDPEMSGSTWTVGDGTLAIGNGATSERYSFVVEGNSLHLRALDPAGDRPGEGWMLFRRNGEIMHVAFIDNLEGRPTGFVPWTGDERLTIVVVLRRRF